MDEQIILPNGARILTQRVPGVRTAALGFFIGTGSRHEAARENGAAHFIEHMLFKGTASRDAGAIAREIDALGGQVNAYTTKEMTCFYAHCLDSHLPRASALLREMVFQSRFDEEDTRLERGVVLEEIDMYEDTPEDLVLERLSAAVYRGCPLARPILGRASTLEGMDGSWLRAYQRRRYVSENITASLAGHFRDEDVETLRACLGALPALPSQSPAPARLRAAVTVKRKSIEQNHLVLAFPAPSFLDPRKYQLALLSALLGGGVSSRLFQELRERKGLCYTVYSDVANHADAGLMLIYTALQPEAEEQALSLIRAQVLDLAEHGPSEEELERVREQARANVLMGLESVQSRMSHMGASMTLYGAVPTPEELLERYDAVTREQVRALAGELFRFEAASLSAVGRVRRSEEYQTLLAR